MPRERTIAIVDGYVDDPAALGVPPYISPVSRAAYGAAVDAGWEPTYVTVDMLRAGKPLPRCDATVLISGNTVPGKYLRSMPMSGNEALRLLPRMGGVKILGGGSAAGGLSKRFDLVAAKDVAAMVYDFASDKDPVDRYRTLGEWNRWMLLGAESVLGHGDFPVPLIAEIETYRGCHRHAGGGCSYCIEPLKGKPLHRKPSDIVGEAARLRELGVRHVRVGGQTCIMSYGSNSRADPPKPNPGAVSDLFSGLGELGFDVLHVDNANPSVIADHPAESREILEVLVERCTPGNVLALGMESADPAVIDANNLNSTPAKVMEAVRAINAAGSARGANGMPTLLPGINLIAGLDGETSATYSMNLAFLRSVLDEGLMLRRINIRQVIPSRREFRKKVDAGKFRRFKTAVREEIDRPMLERMLPVGTVLRDVYMELRDGGNTFGRQIGSYPILVGVPYPVETERFTDVAIIGWGYRSVTGIECPFRVNSAPLAALESLPGVGKKRTAAIAAGRPFRDMGELLSALGGLEGFGPLGDALSFDP
ncbi:MAG: radical SAM protein [Thermoplasmatales archaeon]|nr:radical SAM protein [Thermoplasmatales archaeon]